MLQRTKKYKRVEEWWCLPYVTHVQTIQVVIKTPHRSKCVRWVYTCDRLAKKQPEMDWFLEAFDRLTPRLLFRFSSPCPLLCPGLVPAFLPVPGQSIFSLMFGWCMNFLPGDDRDVHWFSHLYICKYGRELCWFQFIYLSFYWHGFSTHAKMLWHSPDEVNVARRNT